MSVYVVVRSTTTMESEAVGEAANQWAGQALQEKRPWMVTVGFAKREYVRMTHPPLNFSPF